MSRRSLTSVNSAVCHAAVEAVVTNLTFRQLCSEGLLPFGLPVPGEEFVQSGLRLLGDAIEDVGEPGLGVDVVELGGTDQGVHHRRPLAAAIGACEEPGLASERDRAFILPMLGRIASYTTAGTHCSVGEYALKLSNSVPTAP